MPLWIHHNPCSCVDRSRSLRKQRYCIRSANDTWVSSRDVSWIAITGISRELSSFCYYLLSIPCKICQFVTYIPQWYNSLLLDFIVSAKEGVKKDGGQDCNSRSSSCHDQYIFSFVSRNNPL